MNPQFIFLFVASIYGMAAARGARFEGVGRACAGGVADGVHTARLRVVAEPGEGKSALRLELVPAEGSQHPVAARFVGRGGVLVPRLAARSGSWVRIRSGRRVEAPWLVARDSVGREMGRRRLDFDAPVLYRRFSDNSGNYGGLKDNGLLASDDESKYFLKFRLRRDLGDVNGNWAAVRGHRLRVSIAEVDDRADSGEVIRDRARLRQYVRVVNPHHPRADFVVLTTHGDGSVRFRTRLEEKAVKGDIISYAAQARDETLENPDEFIWLEGGPKQLWPEYGEEKIGAPRWLGWPSDLSARVLWTPEKPSEASGVSSWWWRYVSHGVPGPEQSFSVREAIGTKPGDYSFGMSVNGSKVEPPPEGVLGWRFSPDGRSALFTISRWGQGSDDCHDLGLASLQPFAARRVREYLFGQSERFSPDGRLVAFINGSREVLGSMRIGDVLSLRVMNADGSGERTLRTDDDLSSLAWTPQGDVLAATSLAATPKGARPQTGERSAEAILRFERARGAGKLWQPYAWAPLPSPDKKAVAFIGRERAPDGNWRDRSPALNVARSDGSGRRTLTRLSDSHVAYRPFWGRDSRELYLLSMASESDAPSGIVSSPAYNARKPALTSFKVQWEVWAYDVPSGRRRLVACWENLFRPLWENDTPNLDWYFSLLGTSRDGKYLLLRHDEMRRQSEASASVVASSLHGLRLSDGRLLPLAVFASTCYAHAE